MCAIKPFTTNDGSIGLYNTDTEDIYHSVTGAATEAYYKFVIPSNIDRLTAECANIKVLDLCYGIGYNSKIFLNYILKNFLKNKNLNFKNNKICLSPYNDTIYTHNTYSNTYNCEIHSDNIVDKNFVHGNCKDENFNKIFQTTNHETFEINQNFKISITCIDNDKCLGFISPFISSKKINSKIHDEFLNEKIKKYKNLSYNKSDKNYDIFAGNQLYSPAINLYIYEHLINTYPEMCTDDKLNSILSYKKYSSYFDHNICHLFKLFKNKTSKNTLRMNLNILLHNIYYKYITNRDKIDLKALRNSNIDINIKFNDARKALRDDNTLYNIIFLDAFTPSIAPCLWSYDFIKLLYTHTEKNGIVLTYSSAAPVRKAFLDAGYYIGKTFNPYENNYTGTIATKDKSLIEHNLSDYELNLLNTKAGITYKDPYLNKSNEQILADRNTETSLSDLLSATEYKKLYYKRLRF